MTRTPIFIALAATAALAACDNSDHTIVSGPGSDEPPVVTENVQLPPSIVASNSYRCKDNSVVYIDWRSNDTARIKKTRDEVGTTVTKGEGNSFTGADQTLTGSATDQTVTVNGQSCKR